MTSTDTTTTTTTEDALLAQLDRARELAAEWAVKLEAAQDALQATEQTATADVLDHPDRVEEIARNRTDARERVRVTAEVLDRARAAEREAGRALIPAAVARYTAEAAQADAERERYDARTAKLVRELCEHTGTDAWTAGPHARMQYPEQARLLRIAFNARRCARFLQVAQDDDGELGHVLDHAQTDTDALQRLNALMGDYAGARHTIGGKPLAGRRHLPPELQPGGILPLI